jgi:hypothetical protein
LSRIPDGDPDDNALTVLQAQQLGYAVVNYDLDTNDWQYKACQKSWNQRPIVTAPHRHSSLDCDPADGDFRP